MTRDQEALCAKVRMLDDPDRLKARLREIDPSIYDELLCDFALPPSAVIGFGEGNTVVPGSFCARHVPSRTRLRKFGIFLAASFEAVLPLMAELYVTELFAGVGIRMIPRETLRRLALRRARVHDPTPEEIARLEVNFIRHELTSYETNLDAGLNRDAIREQTYKAIAFLYPDLADECARQYHDRTERVLTPMLSEWLPTNGPAEV